MKVKLEVDGGRDFVSVERIGEFLDIWLEVGVSEVCLSIADTKDLIEILNEAIKEK